MLLSVLLRVRQGCQRFLNPIVTKRSFLSTIIERRANHIFDVNTNVSKDVILFKYDNPKYFRYLNLFGISQLGFWMYLSHFSYTTLRDAPVPPEEKENLPWWRALNLGEQKFRNGITAFCAIVGYLFFMGAMTYTMRSVRYLVLKKGGNKLSFVTYGPWGKNSIMDVPLDKVCARESRERARVTLPLKVQGKALYYMLDMRGEFLNKRLFDATAGLHRNLR